MTVGKSSRCTRWDIDFGNSLRKSVDAMLRLDSTSAFIEALSISALIHSCICREVPGTKNGSRFASRPVYDFRTMHGSILRRTQNTLDPRRQLLDNFFVGDHGCDALRIGASELPH